MIRLALIPVILAGLWYFYLSKNGYSMNQGKSGWILILGISVILLATLTLLSLFAGVN